MDRWHPNIVRADEPDVVHRWAELEGKSPTMREELYRHYVPQHTHLRNPIALIGVFGELLAALLDVCCHIYSR